MSRTQRFVVWTGRFSNEQVSIAIIVGYLSVIAALAYLAWHGGHGGAAFWTFAVTVGIDGFAYVDLISMLSKAQNSERLTTGRLLALAHGHSTGTPCDACWDEATLLTLEAHGWTIERR